MKGDKMLKLIGQIDDALIEEAIRPAPAKKKSRRAFWAVPIAAVLALGLTVGVAAHVRFGGMFVAPKEARVSNTAEHFISVASWKPDGTFMSLYIDTTDENPREIYAEVWQDDEFVSSGEYDIWFDTHVTDFFHQMNEGADHNCYGIQIFGVEGLNNEHPVEIRVYDSSTNELLCKDTVMLNSRQ